MKNKPLAAILTGVLFAATTQLAVAAKGPDYTYAEIGYVNTDGDHIEGDGFDVNISFGATDLIFLKFGFQGDSLDCDPVNCRNLNYAGPQVTQVGVNADRFLIGGGAHYQVMDKLDVFGSLSYVDIEYSGGIPTRGDDGYELAVGVRSMVTKELELNASAAYLSIKNLVNNDDSDTVYSVGAVYKFYKKFSLVGDYAHGELVDNIGIGVRLSL
jgi:predicted porin